MNNLDEQVIFQRVMTYRRVSGKGQLCNNGTGLDRQKENIDALVKIRGYTVVKDYPEIYTGTEENRPKYVQMLEDMEEKDVKTIIVEGLDRMSRDLYLQLVILAHLKSKGYALISAVTGEDITASMDDDPMKRALVQVQAVFAELEKNLLIRRLTHRIDSRLKSAGAGSKRVGEIHSVDIS